MKIKLSVLGIFCAAMLLGSGNLVFAMQNNSDNESSSEDLYSDENLKEGLITQNEEGKTEKKDDNKDSDTEELLDEIEQKVENNSTLDQKEIKEIKEKIEELNDSNIPVNPKEIISSGISKSDLKLYLKKGLDGALFLSGSYLIYLAIYDPCALCKLIYDCPSLQAAQVIDALSGVILCAWGSRFFLKSAGSWLLSCLRILKKTQKVE